MTNSATTRAAEEVAHPFVQPYVRLMQRNAQLFMQFAGSPEMVSLWLKNGQGVFNQAFQSAVTGETEDKPGKIAAQAQNNLAELGNSQAFAGFLQGLMRSQMQFFIDVAQTQMATLTQSPVKLMEQMQQAASKTMPLHLAPGHRPRGSKHTDH
jgi:hypothetical protein